MKKRDHVPIRTVRKWSKGLGVGHASNRGHSQARLAFATNEHEASLGWARVLVHDWSVQQYCISSVVIVVDLHKGVGEVVGSERQQPQPLRARSA
jgi:hypothetical protein